LDDETQEDIAATSQPSTSAAAAAEPGATSQLPDTSTESTVRRRDTAKHGEDVDATAENA